MTTAARTTIREFAPADYGRWIDIVNASYPDYGWTVEEMRPFDLHEDCRRDVPSPDPATPGDRGRFLRELEGPSALLEAYFTAVAPDGAWLGVSDLWASLAPARCPFG